MEIFDFKVIDKSYHWKLEDAFYDMTFYWFLIILDLSKVAQVSII